MEYNEVEKKLEKYVIDNTIIDGKKVEKVRFPEIDANIFVSHSHKNKDKEIDLAGWLNKSFRLKYLSILVFEDILIIHFGKLMINSVELKIKIYIIIKEMVLQVMAI